MGEDRRAHLVERFKQRLLQHGNPYGQMFLILSLTGLAGFLASVVLRSMGLAHFMGARYLLSVGIAYAVFLMLLGIWLSITRGRRRSTNAPIIVADGNDVANAILWTDPGMGGPIAPLGDFAPDTSSSSGGTSSGLGNIGDVGDGEGALLVVILLIVVAVLAAIFASVWVLFEAPVLLAELLVDGALVAGMARRLRVRDNQPWALTAVRRTIVPFLITAAAFAFVGFGLQFYVPQATTMLEALQMATR